ncbi:trace amine-associated receptor 1-like [Lampris incognitus]|uniref:trace amine-associated receptor 1-like n=1 Tax=Lampris incognitus TaxID=2546036 RepID=UPI0024B567A0|nr:trace amine-associated receptor 1-like [Lampris incognitus]
MMETLEGVELCFSQLLNTSCRKPMRSHSEAILFYILLSFISLLTVMLNLLVIISISHFRQLQTPTNLLLLSLAVSDLLVGLLLMPVEGLHSFGTCWFLGDFLCAASYFMVFLITSASVGNMVLISIDRYVAICDPLHYPIKITQKGIQISVCLCWVCSGLYSSLVLKDLLTQPGKYNSCHGECVVLIDFIAGTVYFVLTFIIPVSVIAVLYIRIFVVAVSQARAMRSHVATVTVRCTLIITAKKSERKATSALGIVIFVFLMRFCPYYYLFLTGEEENNNHSSSYFVIFLYGNSYLNPLIYAFFYPWFRKAIKQIATLKILQQDSCKAKMVIQ